MRFGRSVASQPRWVRTPKRVATAEVPFSQPLGLREAWLNEQPDRHTRPLLPMATPPSTDLARALFHAHQT